MRGSQWYVDAVSRLALADRFGLVRAVEQSLTGFVPAGNDLFTLEGGGAPAVADAALQTMPWSQLQQRARSAAVDEAALTRAIDGVSRDDVISLIQSRQRVQKLLGALLSFGRPLVRYSAGGAGSEAPELAKAVAAYTARGTTGDRWDLLSQTALGDERPLLLLPP